MGSLQEPGITWVSIIFLCQSTNSMDSILARPQIQQICQAARRERPGCPANRSNCDILVTRSSNLLPWWTMVNNARMDATWCTVYRAEIYQNHWFDLPPKFLWLYPHKKPSHSWYPQYHPLSPSDPFIFFSCSQSSPSLHNAWAISSAVHLWPWRLISMRIWGSEGWDFQLANWDPPRHQGLPTLGKEERHDEAIQALAA